MRGKHNNGTGTATIISNVDIKQTFYVISFISFAKHSNSNCSNCMDWDIPYIQTNDAARSAFPTRNMPHSHNHNFSSRIVA